MQRDHQIGLAFIPCLRHPHPVSGPAQKPLPTRRSMGITIAGGMGVRRDQCDAHADDYIAPMKNLLANLPNPLYNITFDP
jgi:hypothetical protein